MSALPPVDFLFDSSKNLLDSLKLAALNRAANQSKDVASRIDEWIKHEATVLLVEWFTEHREEILRHREIEVPPHKVEFLERDKKKSA